jgi:7,8-dihydropterin-6-yl-methyl-4-(beta-D-ribofuranosyl)aminobenzene 5'-phosphate synthase
LHTINSQPLKQNLVFWALRSADCLDHILDNNEWDTRTAISCLKSTNQGRGKGTGIMRSMAQPMNIGTLRRLRILCISETGWFDDATLIGDVKAAGGMEVSQYALMWPPFGDLHADNAAGSSALIEAEEINGAVHRLLFDTGWNSSWMDRRFAEEGVDGMLQRGEIEALVISHEHFDHFWGISSTLRHRPDLPVYIPEGFHPEGLELIRKAGHQGELTIVHPDGPVVLFPGFALANLEMHTVLQVDGENSVFVNLEGKGFALVTGCGHAGVLNLLDYTARTFAGGERIYALYGGLHISPFNEWDDECEGIVKRWGGYGLHRLACNHCTGARAVQAMIDDGLPVVRGTAGHGSKTDLFLGNGDYLEL